MTTDLRCEALHALAHDFLTTHDLHPDPELFLAQGFVDLALKAWPTASGERLDIATRWALWTWRMDDLLDAPREDEPDVYGFASRFIDVLHGSMPRQSDHPAAHALADLVVTTRQLMPDDWWGDYQVEMTTWLLGATHKLTSWRSGATPNLLEYRAARTADGGMPLLALWTELALQRITPDRANGTVVEFLDAFSSIGTLMNDLLEPDDETFSVQAALARSRGIPVAEARRLVHALLAAERRRFWYLKTAIVTAPPAEHDSLSITTAAWAEGIDQALQALVDWTKRSPRYATPAVSC